MDNVLLETTMIIPVAKYEELVRESEQLNTIKRMVKRNQYVGSDDLKSILNIDGKAGES